MGDLGKIKGILKDWGYNVSKFDAKKNYKNGILYKLCTMINMSL